jgi:hypothetical protein
MHLYSLPCATCNSRLRYLQVGALAIPGEEERSLQTISILQQFFPLSNLAVQSPSTYCCLKVINEISHKNRTTANIQLLCTINYSSSERPWKWPWSILRRDWDSGRVSNRLPPEQKPDWLSVSVTRQQSHIKTLKCLEWHQQMSVLTKRVRKEWLG